MGGTAAPTGDGGDMNMVMRFYLFVDVSITLFKLNRGCDDSDTSTVAG